MRNENQPLRAQPAAAFEDIDKEVMRPDATVELLS
jgi:hypothetical protein